MFLGTELFWTLLKPHFNPCLKTRAKMSLRRAQTTFMPANINSIVLLFYLQRKRKSLDTEIGITQTLSIEISSVQPRIHTI